MISSDPHASAVPPAGSIPLPPTASGRGRKFLRLFAVVILTGLVGNLLYVALTSGFDDLDLGAVRNPEYLLLAGLFIVIPMLFSSTRVFLWTRVLHKPLRYRQAVTAVACGEVAASLTPTAVGGGYAKLYYLCRNGLSPAQATLVMMLGSLEDAVFLGLLLGIVVSATGLSGNSHIEAALVQAGDRLIFVALAVPIGALIAWLIWRKIRSMSAKPAPGQTNLSIREKVIGYLRELRGTAAFAFTHGRRTFPLTVLLSGIGWCFRYTSITAILLAFGVHTDPFTATFLHWCVFSLTGMVATPGGMGGAETSFAVIFATYVPGAVLPVLTLVWRFVTFYLLTLVAIGIVVSRGRNLVDLFSHSAPTPAPVAQPRDYNPKS